MSTIIMLFMLPIGILTYYWDKRVYKQGLETFREYIKKIKHADLSDDEKMKKIDIMFYENSYKISHLDSNVLVAEKKHFNIGVLFILFGALNYFGIIGYIIYYRFFLKPRSLKIDIARHELITSS